jgi:signal transduction histidine kinase
MPKGNNLHQSERVLVCAPFGRDGSLVQKHLLSAGLIAQICSSAQELSAAIGEGAGAAVISDEALTADSVECLRAELARQAPWSDFPVIIMTSGGDTTRDSRYRLRLLEPLGNVSLLERPLRTATLISSVTTALRARRRQYQLAAYLQERDEKEREIVRQNEALVKANGELEEFAYVSSHDLQEPLRMINIYTQLLVREFAGRSENAQQYANFIEGGVKRMEKLLSDLLIYSRTIHPETAKVDNTDLSKSLAQALATLDNRIEESGADIEFNQLPTVSGDETQLAQVFQNLLSNALKYRRPDVSPRIVISAEQQGKEWVVSVTDNGIGFDQQYARRIFGLFKRLHKDAYPGTGLGLAICHRIIERCGGRMWAEGRPGDGSTFYLAFPIQADESARDDGLRDHRDGIDEIRTAS